MIDAFLFLIIGLYLAAVILHFKVNSKAGFAAYTTGAVINLSLSINRWIESGHEPFSNMYETLLTLGACIYLLHLITEYGMKVKAPWIDPLIAAIVVTGAFFQERGIKPLMPALQSPLFFPHVFAYIIAYAAMAKACALAMTSVISQDLKVKIQQEKSSYEVICLGFPLLTAGLLLGAVWAKLAWGDYWSWDPKEMWSLITWMTYIGYFHFRSKFGPRHTAIPWLVALGLLMVILSLLWVNLSRIFAGGLHSYV